MGMAHAIGARTKTLKVLVADDDPDVLQLLAGRCAEMGFEVQTATNGLQALIMARQNWPHVLIADVNMPEVDGLSLCLSLLAPPVEAIEIIVITASSDQMTIDRCEACGAIYGQKGPDLWTLIQSTLVKVLQEFRPEASEAVGSDSGAPIRDRSFVLVVDDDPDVGRFLASRLRKCGINSALSTDGINGYEVALREKPNLIISNFFMPTGNVNLPLFSVSLS